MLEGVDLSLVFEIVEAETAARRAVNAERHAELFGGAKDRLKVGMAEGFVHDRRRGQKRADHVELFDRVAQLLGGALRILNRQHGDAFETRISFDVAGVKPVVIGA